MAEAAATLSLSEQYLLKEKEEKPVVDEKPVEVQGESVPAPAVSEESHPESTVGIAETVMDKAVETAEAVADKAVGITEAVTDGITEGTPVATEEPTETAPAAAETSSEDAPPASEETTEQPTEENSGTEEVAEAPEIKLETAPADFRFPTTNQTRHCFTRYIEYHRCVAAKGDDAQDCQKFAKYYRSLCPSEWVDRWNEQRENGTFPGPL